MVSFAGYSYTSKFNNIVLKFIWFYFKLKNILIIQFINEIHGLANKVNINTLKNKINF